MSFLNPVNEPVKRFSSTDAGAPQINYNTRVAGDVKTVLKACLVTGYGDKASAGWSVVNEVNHVAEFVSPSAAMSDYRLGIDDTSASSTTWYYQYQDARVNPVGNTPSKGFSGVDTAHASNGWQLLITARGLVFVELVQSTEANKLSARITVFSQLKSALLAGTGNNIMFLSYGHNAATAYYPTALSSGLHFRLSGFSAAIITSACSVIFDVGARSQGVSSIDLASPFYLITSNDATVLALVPPILPQADAIYSDMFGANERTLEGRPALSVSCGYSGVGGAQFYGYSRTFLIYLDYWEY